MDDGEKQGMNDVEARDVHDGEERAMDGEEKQGMNDGRNGSWTTGRSEA
jgi:hypothetical protein